MRLALLALLAAGPAHGYELKQRLERLLGPAYPPHNIGQVYVTLRRLETSGLIEDAEPDAEPEPDAEAGPEVGPPAGSAAEAAPQARPAKRPTEGPTEGSPVVGGSARGGAGSRSVRTRSASRPETAVPPTPSARPSRRTYRLTAAGREAVAAWFEQPVEQPRTRSEFFLKLALAPVSGMADQVVLINQQRRQHLQTLRRLTPLTRADPGEEPPGDRPGRDPRIARLLAVGALLHLQADLDWLEQCQRELG